MNIPIVGAILVLIIATIALGFLESGGLDRSHSREQTVSASNPAELIVIGSASKEMIDVLSSKGALEIGISYQANIDPSKINEGLLSPFDAVILQGEPYFDMNAREAVRDYVLGGGRLIVIGDCGSKHADYPNVAGWSWPGGNGLPVPARLIGEWEGVSDTANAKYLRVVDTSHDIVSGLSMRLDFNGTEKLFKTFDHEGGHVIVSAHTDEGDLAAIIEGGVGEGQVIYFAYDPGKTPKLFLNAIDNLI